MPSKEREPPEERVDRCMTGIEGLDNILNGGVPRGNTILVTGAVGTGKTSMCLEFLVHGALFGETGLFISVTESSEKLLKNIIPYDFFEDRLVTEGRRKSQAYYAHELLVQVVENYGRVKVAKVTRREVRRPPS